MSAILNQPRRPSFKTCLGSMGLVPGPILKLSRVQRSWFSETHPAVDAWPLAVLGPLFRLLPAADSLPTLARAERAGS